MASKMTYKELEQWLKEKTTELKEANAALKQEKEEHKFKTEQLQNIFDQSQDLICIGDSRGNIKRINPAFKRVLGYTEKDMLSRLFLEFIHPDDRERTEIIIEQRLYKGENVPFFENRWLCKDGSTRWVGWAAYSDEKAGERYAIGRDITERKLIEEELRKAHDELEKKTEELRKIFNLSLDLICIGDFHGNIKKINPAIERMFGYTEEELLSKPYLEFIHPDDRENLAIISEQSLYKGENVPFFENRWLSKDGSTRWVGWTAYSDEKAGEIYAIGRDITKRKLIEEELRKAHDELEKRVEERTEELARANAELKKQTHNLEETNAALKIVLRQREQDKKELEEKVVSNVKEMVLPFVEKLNKKLPDDTLQVYLDIIKSHLEDITGPFTHQLFSRYSDLTPSEIKIAGLVKDGKTTKEIAELLDASRDTVSFHRRSLRKKLDLRNRKINLRAHLSSLT